MSESDALLLTQPDENWKDPGVTDNLGVDSDLMLGYAFYPSPNWPSYIFANGSFSAQYGSVVDTNSASQPASPTPGQQALINYFLSDTSGSVGGFADVHYRDSFSDVSTIQFHNDTSWTAGQAQIFISDADINGTAAGSTFQPYKIQTFDGNPRNGFGLAFDAGGPSNIKVFISGVLDTQNDYTLSSDHLTLTFNSAQNPADVKVYLSNSYFSGDIVLDNDQAHSSITQGQLGVGQQGAEVILHELGHSLGLIHANSNPQDALDVNAGLTGDFATEKYTIMGTPTASQSIGDPDVESSTTDPNNATNWVFATGLQLYDIAAIQSMYGRNYFTRDEDGTVYTGGTVSSVVQAFGADKSAAFLYTIWDGAGIHDKIDATGYLGNAEIDLRQGHFSSIGSNGSGGTVSFDTIDGSGNHIDHGNVAIAYHSIIEDAVGTGQDDVLIGNDWGNTLTGAAGDDVLFGDGGLFDGQHEVATVDQSDSLDPNRSKPTSDNDVLIGGANDDVLMAGAGTNQIACGGDAVTDGSGNITGSTNSGTVDTYIIAMASGQTASATIGESAKTATVSNASGGESNTTLFAIDDVVAARFDVGNQISLSSSANMSGGMIFTDADATTLASVQTYLTTKFSGINALNPLGAITTGSDIHLGSTDIGAFYNFGTVSATASDDDFVLKQFAGRTFNGLGGNDTADYSNLTSLPIHLTQSPTSFDFQVNDGGAQSDTLVSVEHIIGTSMDDTFTLVHTQGVTFDGGAGSNKADFSGIGGGFGIVLHATPPGSTTPSSLTVSAPGTADTFVSVQTIVGTSGLDIFQGTNGTVDDGSGHHLTYIGNGGNAGAGDLYEFTIGIDTGLVELSSASTLYHDNIELSDIETIASENDLVLSETSSSANGVNYVDLVFSGTTSGDGLDVRLNKDQVLAGDFDSVQATFTTDPTGVGFNAKNLVNYLSDHAAEGATALNTDMALFFSAGNDYYHYADNGGASTLNGSGTGHDHVLLQASGPTATYAKSLANPLDLIIGYGTGGSNLTVHNFFDPTTTNHQIDQVDFSDGTVHTLSYILQHVFTQTGTAGDDVLTGADYTYGTTDWLYGLAGNDTLNGGVGADTMVGGTGNDTYIVDNAGDVVVENSGEGTDLVQSSITYALLDNFENLTLTGTGNINGTGNGVANIITGNSGNNTLDGGLGADTMIGGGGNDTFVVDNAGDVVTGGSGTDTIQSSLSWDMSSTGHNNTAVENLILTGSANINGTGNSLDNLIISNTGIDTLTGGAGNDTYILNNSADVVVENSGEGTDTVQASFGLNLASFANVENVILTGSGNFNATGNAAVNVLTGNSGDNTLDGSAGADTLIGGGGNDTFIVDNTSDIVTAGSGTDTIQSSISWDMSSAGHNNSNVENLSFTGSSNMNGTGNSLDNILTSNTGLDTLAGGLGNDTYIVNNSSDVINENLGEGTDTVNTSLAWTLGNNIENLTLTGSNAVNGTGNSLDNVIIGNDAVNTLIGNDGNDTMSGFSGNDSLNGGTGNDVLDGGAGVDWMIGGTGNDTFYVDNSSDVIGEGTNGGTDTVFSSATFSLALAGSVEVLVLTGTANINGTGTLLNNCTIIGNSGDNVLDDGGGRVNGVDTLIGGLGNDTFNVNNDGTVVVENPGEGIDTVVTIRSWTLGANIENLTLLGDNSGGTGNNLDNTIIGNITDNILNGAGGVDTLIGGTGNDTYIVDTTTDTIIENAGEGTRDEIQANMSFDLSSNSMYANIEYLQLTGSGSFTATGNALDNYIATGSGNSGNCTLDGGAGADTMLGGLGNDVFLVDNVGDTILGGLGGTDTVLSSVTHTLETGLLILTLTGSANINGTGNSSVNVITGNSGNNTLDGGTGADTLIGGGGNDTFIVDNAGDSVTGGSGTDTVLSGISFTLSSALENLTLTGTSNINGIGNGGANVITGNSGNNTLDGGGGADTLTGGTGDDTYVINNSGVTIVESSGAGTDTIQTSMTFDLTSNAMYSNIENLTLTGSSNINGTGNSFDNLITANSGIDTLSGGLGNDTYIIGNASDTIVESTSAGTDLVQSGITFSISSFANVENLTLTGSANINGTGNSAVNIITGNSGNNTLDGGGASDTLIGGVGDDTYVLNNTGITITEGSGAGTDTISTNMTFDLTSNAMYANIENLTLTGTSAIIGTGTSGANVLTGNGISGTSLVGGLGNDTYYLGASDTVVESSSSGGTDTVNEGRASYTLGTNVENLVLTGTSDINGTGNTLANIITGNTGNNTLDGGTGSDTLIGGLGNDVYLLDATTDVVTENTGEGTDTVLASITGYTLAANVENLTLSGTVIAGTGNALNNVITGNTAANTLDGGAGSDTLIGGTGNDTYIVDNISDVVTENSSEGTDSVTFTSATAGDTYTLGANIENLTLSGTANINGTGNGLVNVITGNSGDNSLDGGTGADSMIGGTGNDTYFVDNTSDVVTEAASAGTDTEVASVSITLALNVENLILASSAGNINGTGNALVNVITGNSGDNALDGGTGADTLIGGGGNDTFIVDNASDVVTAGSGNDTIKSSISWDMSSAGHNNSDVENLILTGSSVLSGKGNSLDNVITGNTGADTLTGSTGNDTYVITNASTVIVENASEGTDIVQFGSTTASTTYTLASNVENLTLTGSTAINGTGNSLDNVITGNSAANTLNGSTGNDTLDGGDGLDTLTGGTATDIFLFHSATAFHNIDVVTDFSTAQTDKINIADLLTGFHSGTDNIADFVSLVTSGSNTLLKVDMDGTGGAFSMTQIATLNGITGLSAATLLANGELIVS